MDFGNKITEIRGGWTDCTITFDNGQTLKCYGELFPGRFAIYKSSLHMTDAEVNTLRVMIENNAKEKPDGLNITIE